jgi:hypothetical protein
MIVIKEKKNNHLEKLFNSQSILVFIIMKHATKSLVAFYYK